MTFDWTKTTLDRIDHKLDKIEEKLTSLDITAAEHQITLEEHTRRSTANEENLALLRLEFKPVEKHVALVGACFKLLGFLATIIGIITGLFQIIKIFFKI